MRYTDSFLGMGLGPSSIMIIYIDIAGYFMLLTIYYVF